MTRYTSFFFSLSLGDPTISLASERHRISMRIVHRKVERRHDARMRKGRGPRVVRVMVRARRKVHMRRSVYVRHVGDGGPMMMVARRPPGSEPGSGSSSGVRIMMRDEAVDHRGIGVKPASMVVRRRRRGKHGGRITGGVSGMRRSQHSRGSVGKFDGGKGFGRHPLIRRKELRKGVEMMGEIRRVMRVVRMRRRIRRGTVVRVMRVR